MPPPPLRALTWARVVRLGGEGLGTSDEGAVVVPPGFVFSLHGFSPRLQPEDYTDVCALACKIICTASPQRAMSEVLQAAQRWQAGRMRFDSRWWLCGRGGKCAPGDFVFFQGWSQMASLPLLCCLSRPFHIRAHACRARRACFVQHLAPAHQMIGSLSK